MPKYLDETGLAHYHGNVEKRPVQTFETVASMQAATWLKSGMTCHTNGFRASGDGGAAYYTVSASGTANGMDVLALQGGLFATLVVTEPYVTPEQFGAWGDGTHDDTAALQAAVNAASVRLAKNYSVVATTAKPNCVTIPSNRTIEFDSATVMLESNALNAYSIFNISGVSNVEMYGNGSIEGDKASHTGTTGEWGHCVNIVSAKNVSITGLSIIEGWGDGVYIGSGGVAVCENVDLRNCDVSDNGRNNIAVTAVDRCTIDGCTISKADRTAPKAGVDFEPNNNDIDYIDMCVLSNCLLSDNGAYDLSIAIRNATSHLQRLSIANCILSSKGNVFDLESDKAHVDASDVMHYLPDLVSRTNVDTVRTTSGSSLKFSGSMHNLNSSITPILLSTEANDVTINLECFGGTFERPFATYGTPSSNNCTLNMVCHFAAPLPESMQEIDIVHYKNMFTDATTFTTAGTFPACGGEFVLSGSTGTRTNSFRLTRAQVGTRYIIKNTSDAVQIIACTPSDTLALNHMGIYEVFSFGTVTKVLDIELT